MARKFFRRLSARYRANQSSTAWYLQPLRAAAEHPVYFSPNRRGVAGGLALGLFVGALPLPAHTLIALILALALRVNVPGAVLSIWYSNPLTFAPILYAELLLGQFLLGMPAGAPILDLSLKGLTTGIIESWQPVWVGAIVGGGVLAAIAYFLITLAWGISVRIRYRRRRSRPESPAAGRP